MFPKLASVRNAKVNIGGKSIEIKPWTNRNVLYYENAKDIIQANIDKMSYIDIFEKKQMFMEAVFEHLVKPNINYIGNLSAFEKEVLFIEMYKLSRGTIILLSYECPTCKGKSENQFNIDRDYKFTDVKIGDINTKDVRFTVHASSLEIPSDILDEDRLIYFYCSFVREFKYKDKQFIVDNLKDFVTWMLDELDEVNYNEFLSLIQTKLPTIRLCAHVKCDFCRHEEEFVMIQLPDFSLVTL